MNDRWSALPDFRLGAVNGRNGSRFFPRPAKACRVESSFTLTRRNALGTFPSVPRNRIIYRLEVAVWRRTEESLIAKHMAICGQEVRFLPTALTPKMTGFESCSHPAGRWLDPPQNDQCNSAAKFGRQFDVEPRRAPYARLLSAAKTIVFGRHASERDEQALGFLNASIEWGGGDPRMATLLSRPRHAMERNGPKFRTGMANLCRNDR